MRAPAHQNRWQCSVSAPRCSRWIVRLSSRCVLAISSKVLERRNRIASNAPISIQFSSRLIVSKLISLSLALCLRKASPLIARRGRCERTFARRACADPVWPRNLAWIQIKCRSTQYLGRRQASVFCGPVSLVCTEDLDGVSSSRSIAPRCRVPPPRADDTGAGPGPTELTKGGSGLRAEPTCRTGTNDQASTGRCGRRRSDVGRRFRGNKPSRAAAVGASRSATCRLLRQVTTIRRQPLVPTK